MNLLDYEKYYHSGSEFIIPRDEFEKIIEENQRLNNVLNELEKLLNQELETIRNDEFFCNLTNEDYIVFILDKLNELKEGDK